MNLLKLLFFWPVALIQGIFLFLIHLVITLFSKKGQLVELARKRDLFGIKMLISQGHNINERNAYGQTPLHGVFLDTKNPFMTIMTIKVLNFLIDNGADVNIVDVRNWSPLLYAIGANYTQESIYLINTENILLNKKFYAGRTALHYAAQKNNAEVVKCLLEKGADPEICDNFGIKPFQCCKDKKTLNLFLKKEQALI